LEDQVLGLETLEDFFGVQLRLLHVVDLLVSGDAP
jgi:hypothetical protein